MNYITIDDLKDKPLVDKIQKAGWTDRNIENAIIEAEGYIEGYLVRLGYSREQLKKSDLVKTMCLNYARYVILRDIYTMMAPSTSAGEEYTKWKENVDKMLEDISNFVIRLVDRETGELIIPVKRELEVKSTTRRVRRAVTMAPDYEWSIDSAYYGEEVLGDK